MPHESASSPAPRAIACPTCALVHRVGPVDVGCVAQCTRCGTVLRKGVHNSLGRTAAFSLAALFLYLPANLYPILNLELYGARSENTVLDGVSEFYKSEEYFMAAVVLMASIVVPVVKLLCLFFLVVTTWLGWKRLQKFRTHLFAGIETIGRWAMLDVFVLSIWVAVVKLDSLGSVSPGPALLPFGCVVILTLLATASFDPQLIWQRSARA